MQKGWRVGEGAEGLYQEGQAWVNSFSSHFTLESQRSVCVGVVVLGPLPPCFSHSFLELPLLVHLGKFPLHVGVRLGVSLPHGLHSAQLTFEGPLGMSGSATRTWAAGSYGLTEDWSLLFPFPSL